MPRYIVKLTGVMTVWVTADSEEKAVAIGAHIAKRKGLSVVSGTEIRKDSRQSGVDRDNGRR